MGCHVLPQGTFSTHLRAASDCGHLILLDGSEFSSLSWEGEGSGCLHLSAGPWTISYLLPISSDPHGASTGCGTQ